MFSIIQQHRGRVVGTAGDSVLGRVCQRGGCSAVCGGDSEGARGHGIRGLPEDRRMEFRIGINLGDVIEEEDTIYGDGVNIAARMQSLAEGGRDLLSRVLPMSRSRTN